MTEHDRRQLAGQWAKRWPAAMTSSPYLTPAELAKARRRAARLASRRASWTANGRTAGSW